MGQNTETEWATHTFNPWRIDGDKRVVAAESMWKKPLKWDREAKAAGVRHRVFCASMADVFEDWQGPILNAKGKCLWWDTDKDGNLGWYDESGRDPHPVSLQDVRNRLFALIDATPNLDWLLLTKRPENVAAMMPPARGEPFYEREGPYEIKHDGMIYIRPNVWIGATVENQQAADKRIPHLLRVPARVRFLSCEPMLGPINFEYSSGVCHCGIACNEHHMLDGHSPVDMPHSYLEGIDWVICGGESGPHARPSHPDWFRSLRNQCTAAGVTFFFKQWGEWAPSFDGDAARDTAHMDGDVFMSLVGKAAAGRLIDGKEWNEVPR